MVGSSLVVQFGHLREKTEFRFCVLRIGEKECSVSVGIEPSRKEKRALSRHLVFTRHRPANRVHVHGGRPGYQTRGSKPSSGRAGTHSLVGTPPVLISMSSTEVAMDHCFRDHVLLSAPAPRVSHQSMTRISRRHTAATKLMLRLVTTH